MFDILAEIHPATVRATCYRLFVGGLIRSMAKTETNRVSYHLRQAREELLIPWEWVVDETREKESVPTWQNPQSLLEAAAHGYRRDFWSAQPERIEVRSEKGTVRGTLAPVLERYGITFRVMHGFGSATAVKDAADSTGAQRLLILYAGDRDPSGQYMSDSDLPQRLSRYGAMNFDLRRIAVVESDATDSLPWFPATDKTGDSRYRWFVERFGSRCWELDALSPPVLRERVKSAIVSRIDRDAWNHSARIEAVELESMRTFIDGYPGKSGLASF